MKRFFVLAVLLFQLLCAEGQQVVKQSMEIIYGRKDGMALTMLVQPPVVASNKRAVIWVVSAGWTSDFNWINMFKIFTKPFSDRGYTVFFVTHGSTSEKSGYYPCGKQKIIIGGYPSKEMYLQ